MWTISPFFIRTSANEGHNLGTLKATSGSFNYTLDPSTDPYKVKAVVIYCRAFSVFSTASLQTP